MKAIGFSVTRFDCVEPEVLADGSYGVYVETNMTAEQMFYALQMFRTLISEKTWNHWLERIAEEAA